MESAQKDILVFQRNSTLLKAKSASFKCAEGIVQREVIAEPSPKRLPKRSAKEEPPPNTLSIVSYSSPTLLPPPANPIPLGYLENVSPGGCVKADPVNR